MKKDDIAKQEHSFQLKYLASEVHRSLIYQ